MNAAKAFEDYVPDAIERTEREIDATVAKLHTLNEQLAYLKSLRLVLEHRPAVMPLVEVA